MWKHDNKPISFTLIVNDFLVKYTQRKDALELLEILQQNYEAVTTNWMGTLYRGITLECDYIRFQVNLSMPGYITKTLHQFQHESLTSITMTAIPYIPPVYGKKV